MWRKELSVCKRLEADLLVRGILQVGIARGMDNGIGIGMQKPTVWKVVCNEEFEHLSIKRMEKLSARRGFEADLDVGGLVWEMDAGMQKPTVWIVVCGDELEDLGIKKLEEL
jgi:hypothetical protein